MSTIPSARTSSLQPVDLQKSLIDSTGRGRQQQYCVKYVEFIQQDIQKQQRQRHFISKKILMDPEPEVQKKEKKFSFYGLYSGFSSVSSSGGGKKGKGSNSSNSNYSNNSNLNLVAITNPSLASHPDWKKLKSRTVEDLLHNSSLSIVDGNEQVALTYLSFIPQKIFKKSKCIHLLNRIFVYGIVYGMESVCLFLCDRGFPSHVNSSIAANVKYDSICTVLGSSIDKLPQYLITAVAFNMINLVRALLKLGASINQKWCGLTPLMVAVMKCKRLQDPDVALEQRDDMYDMLRVLLELGADVNIGIPPEQLIKLSKLQNLFIYQNNSEQLISGGEGLDAAKHDQNNEEQSVLTPLNIAEFYEDAQLLSLLSSYSSTNDNRKTSKASSSGSSQQSSGGKRSFGRKSADSMLLQQQITNVGTLPRAKTADVRSATPPASSALFSSHILSSSQSQTLSAASSQSSVTSNSDPPGGNPSKSKHEKRAGTLRPSQFLKGMFSKSSANHQNNLTSAQSDVSRQAKSQGDSTSGNFQQSTTDAPLSPIPDSDGNTQSNSDGLQEQKEETVQQQLDQK
ncbi:hypothetical protein MP228_009164 [Amoeboaphelidium protococcarum]|nr:hypothetical protein MP228_009164 [Amoeboaphelidium protococcarum]